MKMRMLRRVAAALAILPYLCNAFPTGAGGCEGGVPAVGGSHTTAENLEEGSLNNGNFVVRINGQVLSRNTAMDIPIGVNHVWEISGSDAFRGFLIRLDGGNGNVDTTASLGPSRGGGGAVQVAESVCVNNYGVGGATHRSRALMSTASGELIVDDVSQGMNLDVTVVVTNRNQDSEYYYSGYVLHAVEASSQQPPPDGDDDDDDDDDDDEDESRPITPAPVPDPTNPPVPAPTNPPPTNPPPTNAAPTVPSPTNPPPTNPAPTIPLSVPGDGEQLPSDPNDDMVNPDEFPDFSPLPILEDLWPQCNVNETCGICQGDCDSDLECDGRLACFQRDDWDDSVVPGCLGAGWLGADYCYDPIEYPYALQTYPEDCTAENPCGKCKGDCDDDSECAGPLECFQRTTGSNVTVPGCYGLGLPGADYCFDRSDMVAGTTPPERVTYTPTHAPTMDSTTVPETYPPTYEPTMDTIPVLETPPPTYEPTMDTATEKPYVPVSTYEPTYEPTMDATPAETERETYYETDEWTRPIETGGGGGDYYSNELTDTRCTANSPCSACSGDCDYDYHCKGNLECFPRRVGDYTPIPGCSGRGYAGHDYCYEADPNAVRPRVTPCSPQKPCKKCQGDCDSNADCGGRLKCFHRETGDGPRVPGCRGDAVANIDYCFDPADISGGGNYVQVGRGNDRQLRGGD